MVYYKARKQIIYVTLSSWFLQASPPPPCSSFTVWNGESIFISEELQGLEMFDFDTFTSKAPLLLEVFRVITQNLGQRY